MGDIRLLPYLLGMQPVNKAQGLFELKAKIPPRFMVHASFTI
jgi:hypothetical protein